MGRKRKEQVIPVVPDPPKPETPAEGPDPIRSEADKLEFRYLKKTLNRTTAHDVLDEPVYHKDFNKWQLHRMDPRSGNTVIETFSFTTEEAALAAADYVKGIRV